MGRDLEARVRELATLNALGDVLNREPSFTAALGPALERLVGLVELTSGWVFLTNVEEGSSYQGGFRLGAFFGLPPALDSGKQAALCQGSCECQALLQRGRLDRGINMVTCSRLREAHGDRRGLAIHASVPLLGQYGPVGILNLAAPGDARFERQTLAFLTTVGRQLGTAFERSKLQEARTREARYLATLEERNRLAQEMHDSVSQLLFAADLSLDIARASADETQRRQRLAGAQELVRSALSELHGLIEVMRPPDLSGGLRGALARLAQRTSGTVAVQLEGEAAEPAPRVARDLYRIAQEALHNAIRHADAERVRISLQTVGREIVLKIGDDGRGLPGQLPVGLGIEGMRDRAAAHGGSFRIAPGREKGTEVEVRLPWPGDS